MGSCLIAAAQSNPPHALWPSGSTPATPSHVASVSPQPVPYLKAGDRKITNEGERKAKTQMPKFHFRQIKYTKKQETEIKINKINEKAGPCQILKQS